MDSFTRVCIKDFKIVAENGDTFEIKKGETYLTSDVREDGKVVVFTGFWVAVDKEYFGESEQFTYDDGRKHNLRSSS